VTSASRHFRRCYLKENKVNRSEGAKKLNAHIVSESVLMLFAEN